MNFYESAILSLSIIIPGIIGLIRFSKINEAYHPFIYCIWIGFVNESINIILALHHYSTYITSNIYILTESVLLTWQFKRWGLFDNSRILFRLIIAILFAAWIAETLMINNIKVYASYFSIIYSSILTFLSITVINRLIVTERRSLLKNATFIICIAFVIYYTYNVLSEVFWRYGMDENVNFQNKVYEISVVTNFLSIILYSLAILWMPTKRRFTLPSS